MTKIYTLLEATKSVKLTADELLARFDEEEKHGNHIEKMENAEFWGDNTYMVCYW